MRNRDLLEAIIRNGNQALAGPLGYRQRQALVANLKEAQAELDNYKPKVCPICEDSACEVKSFECGGEVEYPTQDELDAADRTVAFDI